MTDLDDLIAKLREAAKRAEWYQTGEAKLLFAAADALEAATRVPVKGEPNNDRENLITERTYGHGSITLTHYRSSGRIGVVQRGENSVMDVADLLVFLQDSGLDEDFSRATVPDAATGLDRVTEGSVRHVKRLTTELYRKRESLNDQRREFRKLLGKARAERDAAVAAIGRVRALHPVAYSGNSRSRNAFCATCTTSWPCPTVAALDEAPEPETAPENYEPKCNSACVVHGSPVTNWPVQYGRRNRETGALHWLTGDPRDDWWRENQDRYEHVKRYTSPPLPVEGEKL